MKFFMPMLIAIGFTWGIRIMLALAFITGLIAGLVV